MNDRKELTALPGGAGASDVGPSMLSPGQLKQRVEHMHSVMKAVMKKDCHFGVIPGTQKPSLWKAGAEKLAMTFGLRVEIQVVEEKITEEEVFYRCRAIARNGAGEVIGSAEGVCSTSEKKYRWREPVHVKEYHALPDHMKRVTWNRKGEELKQVRQDPGDLPNTICQMAGKRAFVQVIRTATGATDIFAADPADDRSETEPRARGESDAPAAAGGASGSDIRVVGVRTAKTGENANGPWTLHAIKFSNDKEATTFNDDWAKLAERAMRENALVTAQVSEGKKAGEWKLDAFELVPA